MVEAPGSYVPQRGDAVWLSFDPQAGHEQAGRRPAVVLSPAAYNGRVGLALLCPITHQIKVLWFNLGGHHDKSDMISV
ncbi:type II toxin-antitoxin system PemK/MazF family toxin, partial [Candidatus Entotheonella palauensis]|uniref:type II toxin-antitoxin system PemK/MazF family toxin n=1 Tax=Candidatus Entotheonella palauensis TaxID=93172 RepID=UPI0015C43B5C